LWDPIHGTIRQLTDWTSSKDQTHIPLYFDPFGAHFIVFRKPSSPPTAAPPSPNFPTWNVRQEIHGPWRVHFDPALRGPGNVEFTKLVSWTTRPEKGIRFYSGTAVYRTTFEFKSETRNSNSRFYLCLGDVREIAEVRLNDKSLGTLWSIPFRADATAALRDGQNDLEIEVVNFWPNRVIGDASLPEAQRITRTNIRKLTAETPLTESGLLGPVRLLSVAP